MPPDVRKAGEQHLGIRRRGVVVPHAGLNTLGFGGDDNLCTATLRNGRLDQYLKTLEADPRQRLPHPIGDPGPLTDPAIPEARGITPYQHRWCIGSHKRPTIRISLACA